MAQEAPKAAGLKAILGDKLIKKDADGKHVEVTFDDELADAKAVAIYFSAHWCPPCRGFTPVLTAASEKWAESKVRVVFITSDQDDGAFKEYFKEMGKDWLSYPFGDAQIKAVKGKYNVQGIPTLIVVSADGETKDDGARGTVMQKKADACKEWL